MARSPNTWYRQSIQSRAAQNKFWFKTGELNIAFTLTQSMQRSMSETKTLKNHSEQLQQLIVQFKQTGATESR